MFERPQGGERAVLVHLNLNTGFDKESIEEFKELVVSSGADPVAVVTGSRAVPHPRYFVGTGKADEIKAVVLEQEADVVLFDHDLSPVQERNLEALLECQVLDRTGLILDIFAQRARSHEGQLQVELAQLRHLSTRLVRGWTHLERQKGGIGLRGPGETQLETDRRLIGHRIRTLKSRLEKVQRQREQGRRARKKADVPTVSLVGYTNAGKSTLFNNLTHADVYAADQLFATLDPTLRRIKLPAGFPVVLADTVGFIRQLPHDLVAAFRSTLKETQDADLLLHVVDASSDERESNMEQVNLVLDEIGADDRPQLMVFNKIDLLDDVSPRIDRDEAGVPIRVWVSALTGEGLDLLYEALAERTNSDMIHRILNLPASAGKLHARLFEAGSVNQDEIQEKGGWMMDVSLRRADWEILVKYEAVDQYIVDNQVTLQLAAEAQAQ
ncbi:MAG: GTPase HflX [Gammaproteobacteria bacterium]|nr:GTPase HflX [Gammaproteobacteria bacterium]MCW8987574.1 GTPase HflX [Gammaproteobacteria bacterium]